MDNTTKSTLYAELREQLTMQPQEIGKTAAALRDAQDVKETAEMLAEILELEEVAGLSLPDKLLYIALEFYGHGALAGLYCYNACVEEILTGN